MWLLLMLLAWLFNGFGVFGLRILAGMGLAGLVTDQYVMYWYLGGFIFMSVRLVAKKTWPDRKEIGIGSLMAHRPLVVDVANNAQSAAFADPRFVSLSLDEYHDMDVHLSILSEPVPMEVASREELLLALRPGMDGLIIDENGSRATYLPSVWEQIPDPAMFVAELRRKAGLSRDGWTEATRVFRYTTEEFS